MRHVSRRARVVFDCNVCLQAFAFEEGPAAEALRIAEASKIELIVSKPTLRELREVLACKDLQAISPNMTSVRIAAFLERLAYRSTLIRRVRHVFDFPRDRRDEPYLDLAIAAKADYLVTRDKDLLWLMTGHTLLCKRFRRKTHPLRVIDPVALLQALGQPWKHRGKAEGI